jgi:3-hydroxyacyl-CoA dehydrogenase
MTVVSLRREGKVAIVTIDNPPVNALGHAVREGLVQAIAAAIADPAADAIVVTSAGRAFSAGADITEFKSARLEPFLPDVINRIEASPKPVVAAINGLALGGGLEVALGCHYRLVGKDVRQLGLPEVKIGLLPGAGGTQRLPRVVGVDAALDLIVSGAPIDAGQAKSIGLVDAVADGDVVAAAVAFANNLIAQGAGPRPVTARPVDTSHLAPGSFEMRRAALARHPSGPWAARACVDAVEAATTLSYADGQKRESALFREGLATPYARALQYAFFAERQAATIPGVGADVKPRAIAKVGIVGAGTMGSGIALAFLNADIPVTIVEMQKGPLDKGVARIGDTLQGLVKRGRLTPDQARARVSRLSAAVGLDALADCDLVIEAVFETMAVKKEVFGALDACAKPGAILATNTSTLDVNEIARSTRRPADVVGLHFFSPANIMRLLEIVRGEATSPDVLATAMAMARRIGKVGVVSGVCFGFIGNRMLESYLEEVQAMLLEGATPEAIDGALEQWGWAMGPLAVMDLAGMDVGWRIRQEHVISEERRRLYRVTDALVESGRHGQKTGAGTYLYGADRKRTSDPDVVQRFRDEAARQGIAQRNTIPADEIVERTLLRLVNTGADILSEGIAARASDIDTVYLNGYGFASWRGGPMWQADVMGLGQVAEKVRDYERRHGARWLLSPLIGRLASEKGTFGWQR